MDLRIAIISIVALSVSGCAAMKKSVTAVAQSVGIIEHVEVKPPSQEAPEDYKKAITFLEQMKFDEARTTLERFLLQNSVSPYTQAANLNLGRALEGLNRWQDAAVIYRNVIQATTRAPKLQAMALYRLSFAYEALNQDQQLIASLSDLKSRVKELPDSIALGEIPARMAAAYARVGNFDLSIDYYRTAENGIARLRQQDQGKLPEWLPRTLFFMGEMSRRQATWDEFESVLRPLARGQVYLLQAAELGQEPWSDRAADDLTGIYESLWRAIETAPLPTDQDYGDPVLAKRELQRRQWERAVLLFESAQELEARILAGEKGSASAQLKKIDTMIDVMKNRVSKMMLERPAGEGLTRESLLRQQAIRGTVTSTDDSLERKFLKSGRESGLNPAKSNPRPPSTSKEDPNL